MGMLQYDVIRLGVECLDVIDEATERSRQLRINEARNSSNASRE